MSTNGPRRFTGAVAIVVASLIVLGGAGAVASITQGPRVSSVSADPDSAIRSSGTRIVLTANQALEDIDPAQVSVTPEADVTVDASGRTVGVRFAMPLREGTTYTVAVKGARGVGGGASADLTASIDTPAPPVYLLRRSVSGDDMIYRAELGADGASEEKVVFTHPHIEDFRRSATGLVISVVEDETARLITTNAEGKNPQDVTLPGPGFVTSLEVSDRGGLIGYLFSDIGVEGGSGNESRLYVSSLRSPQDEARALAVAGEAVSVDHWQFVPDSSALLALHFGGDVVLADPLTGDAPVSLGTARAIESVGRGTYTAVLSRLDERVLVDLRSGTDTPLPTPAGVRDGDTIDSVIPLAGGELMWNVTRRDAAGMPEATTLLIVGADGERELLSHDMTDPIFGICPSPSADRIAVMISPDHASASYDLYLQPLPQKVRTLIYDVSDGKEVADLSGFDMSWCTRGPF